MCKASEVSDALHAEHAVALLWRYSCSDMLHDEKAVPLSWLYTCHSQECMPVTRL